MANTSVSLSVEDALIFAKEQAYWDGYAAGAAATAAHAKNLLAQSAMRKQEAPKGEE